MTRDELCRIIGRGPFFTYPTGGPGKPETCELHMMCESLEREGKLKRKDPQPDVAPDGPWLCKGVCWVATDGK